MDSIDKRLILQARFTNDRKESFIAPIVEWQDHLALVDQPRRTLTTMTWRASGYGMVLAKVTREPGQAWVNPGDSGWEIVEIDNLYNRAVKAIDEGLAPGQEVVLFKTDNGKKATLKRDKSKEEIRLIVVNGAIKSLRFAWWGLDVESVSGRNGKWFLVNHKDYLKWVEETK